LKLILHRNPRFVATVESAMRITILLLIFCRFLTTPAGKRDVFGGDTQKHASSTLNKGITMKRTTIKCHSTRFALAAALTLAAHSACAAVGTLSGPYTHRNLEIFLVHGDTQLEERRYATLGEAMTKRYVDREAATRQAK
jgi:hypothetical protein